MKIDYRRVNDWAPLAWAAKCVPNSSAIEVFHGGNVEVSDSWFGEVVWPGKFDDADFDRTDIVAGSGGRARDGGVVFVSSGNTVDRLLWLESKNETWVSNSLACLLAVSGADIDVSYPRYLEDFSSIVSGLSGYKRTVATTLGDIHIQVFGLLEWDGAQIRGRFKEEKLRDFRNFAAYERFMRETFEGLANNLADPSRRIRYSFIATVSSGYDSPAVAALAHECGCDLALCIDRDRFGAPEGGAIVARHLGLQSIVVDRGEWRNLPGHPECLFIAAGGDADALPMAVARDTLAGKVLVTGYHGDKVWGKDTEDLSASIVRGDPSGLSLSEFRLWAGFIHCPPAFWGVRQIRDINRISKSSEMLPWDVPREYSRPIPRRVVESAGVPREMFGNQKHAAAIGLGEFLGPASLADYRAWLARHRYEWIRRGRLPPLLSQRYELVSTALYGSMDSMLRRVPLVWRLARDGALERPSRLRRFAFSWAVSEVKRRYMRAL